MRSIHGNGRDGDHGDPVRPEHGAGLRSPRSFPGLRAACVPRADAPTRNGNRSILPDVGRPETGHDGPACVAARTVSSSPADPLIAASNHSLPGGCRGFAGLVRPVAGSCRIDAVSRRHQSCGAAAVIPTVWFEMTPCSQGRQRPVLAGKFRHPHPTPYRIGGRADSERQVRPASGSSPEGQDPQRGAWGAKRVEPRCRLGRQAPVLSSIWPTDRILPLLPASYDRSVSSDAA